jgi:hypothetical protein
MSDNPLSSLYRSKNIYVSLPSKGKFYSSGIELSVDGELGVMPMTVRDEILLKSPDSLFNGEALIDVIKSCVPDIKNPNEIPVCDLDSIILAIRAASNPNMELNVECPKCKTENTYNIDLLGYINTIKSIPEDNTITLKDTTTVISLKPYTIKTMMKRKMQEFNFIKVEQKLKSLLKSTKDEDINEDTLNAVKETLDKAYNDSSRSIIEVVAESIVCVELLDKNIKVTDKTHILDWVINMDKDVYHTIVNKISLLNENNIKKTTDVICSKCDHKYTSNLELNPVNFFTKEQS